MAWTGTSTGTSGARIAESWGGNGNGSWINTPLPNNTAFNADPVFEQQGVTILYNNVYNYLTGYEPGTTGYPSGVASYAYINNDRFTAIVNVISQADLDNPANGFEWMPIYMRASGSPSRHIANWAQPTRARGEHMGAPFSGNAILPSKETNGQPDSDGTIIIYLPDWKWPGNPADTRYHGMMINLWGARDPDSNVQFYGLPPVWTAKYMGWIPGVNASLAGAAFNRISGADVTKANSGGFQYVAPPIGAKNPDGTFVNGDPNNLHRPVGEIAGALGGAIAGQETRTYPGFGRDGVATESNHEVPAAHISMAMHLIQKRDCARTCPIHGHPGYIDHALGYMLSAERPNETGGFVWPATGYDGASRNALKQGYRHRLPAGWYAAQNKTGWSNARHMLTCAMERYGIVFLDTTAATGVSFRAEIGANGVNGMSLSNATMRTLPWADLRLMLVGSITDPNPTAGTTTDTTPPTVIARTPAPNATNVPLGSTGISVTFSEAVSSVSGTTFTVTAGTTPIAGTISGTGNVRTFTPSVPLAASTVYTVRLLAGITDSAGNALAPVTWTFTTGTPAPVDTSPPTVTSRTPSPNATGVSLTTPVIVTFSESVANVNTSTFQLLRGSEIVPASLNLTGSTYTLTPLAQLVEGATYTVQLTSGITDLASPANALAPITWSFTTLSEIVLEQPAPTARRPRSLARAI